MILEITPQIRIPFSEIEFSYARSSGPGGQNVNKVNSKAVLRWNLLRSPSLGAEIRECLLRKLRERLNYEGELLIMSDRFRDQKRNREDCLEKLRECLVLASFVQKCGRKPKRPDPVSKSSRPAKKCILKRKALDDRRNRATEST